MGIPLLALFGGEPVALNASKLGDKPAPKQRPRKELLLRPVRPSAAVAAAYQKALLRLVDEMGKSTIWFVEAAYKGTPPELAMDELSSEAMRKAIANLTKRWYKRFDTASEKLAKYFAKAASSRSDAALRKILKDGGFTIDWKMTRPQRDALNAVVNENVSLIKSIPRQHFQRVEGYVMRSVQTGRDMKQLADDLQKSFKITRKRAVIIARDQNNKATGALQRVRQIEIAGDDAEAVWHHSGGGRTPRRTHAKAGREKARFKVKEGWYDEDEGRKVIPGELINCRCFSRLVVKGFS